ncbi:cupin domain-containing protein [Nafulsella turpanensis]|uniref:cupin domain-containing protein n=1 Tax=Nafulsella turpanensis TaxID=1265690 RepID=UPI00034BEA15|nr:cupin domain-containing protein [Nafulsella turpanensis]
MKEPKVISYQLSENGQIPNNPTLPLLIYQQVFEEPDRLKEQFQQAFEKNNWRGSWVNGVFDYHHYHSNAHEVLGIAAGTATIMFGGPEGTEVDVQAGDMVVLPAGTGHCRLSASDDFKVVGAYPAGQEDYDTCTQKDDPDEKEENIRHVSLPKADPVSGESGPLMQHWKK